ncbi:hypothetical protein PMAYCL1PPCAC_24266, partial [Pristionchus mayeri]
ISWHCKIHNVQKQMDESELLDVKPFLPVEELARENGSLRRQLAIRDVELAEKKDELRNTVISLKTALAFKNQKIKDLEAGLSGEDTQLKSIKREVDCEETYTVKRRRVEDGAMELCSSCGADNNNKDRSAEEVYEKKLNVRFTNISKLGESEEYSSATIKLVGVEWGLVVSRSQIDQQEYLSLHLEMRSEQVPDGWSCAVLDRMSLHSHIAGKPAHSGLLSNATVYDGERKSWGYEDFISYKDLFNKRNGYVIDDSIMISAEIKAFPSVIK